ncbi:hypothetical protein HAX54_036362, partial [Datura stramonium]|nr:hypothetical protein [Datura stramonium]
SGPTDPDVIFIGEEAAVTTGSGSGPIDPAVVIIGEEAESDSESWSENSTDESESEVSSDEDNDDSKDQNYQVSESSNSSQFDDITTAFDDQESENDDMSCPTKQDYNEEGKEESNGGGLVPQLAVEVEKHNKRQAYLLQSPSLSKSKKKKLNHGNCSGPILPSDGEESKSSSEEDREIDDSVQIAVRKDRRTRKKILEDFEF